MPPPGSRCCFRVPWEVPLRVRCYRGRGGFGFRWLAVRRRRSSSSSSVGHSCAWRRFITTFFPPALENLQERIHSIPAVRLMLYYGILLMFLRNGIDFLPPHLFNDPQFPLSTVGFGSGLQHLNASLALCNRMFTPSTRALTISAYRNLHAIFMMEACSLFTTLSSVSTYT